MLVAFALGFLLPSVLEAAAAGGPTTRELSALHDDVGALLAEGAVSFERRATGAAPVAKFCGDDAVAGFWATELEDKLPRTEKSFSTFYEDPTQNQILVRDIPHYLKLMKY